AFAITSNTALLDENRPRFITFHQDLLEDEVLDYLVPRAGSPSAHVRSLTQDFIWEKGGTSRRRHALGAAAAYLEVVDIEARKATPDNFGWIRAGDALARAAQLARAANQTTVISTIAERSLALLRDF